MKYNIDYSIYDVSNILNCECELEVVNRVIRTSVCFFYYIVAINLIFENGDVLKSLNFNNKNLNVAK